MFDMMVASASAVHLLRKAMDDGWMRREFIIQYKNISIPPANIDHMNEAWDMVRADQETDLGRELARMFRVRNKLLAHHDLDVARAFMRDHPDYLTAVPYSVTREGCPIYDSDFKLSRFLLLDAIGAPLAEDERLEGDELIQNARRTHATVMKIHNLMIYMTFAYKNESGLRFRAVDNDPTQ